ncbi:nitrite reductase small subunit NirD [Rothia aerolata]|uniref:Nitrite reductase small subunit n=1 Tax=Rothia aerolata TaxID=1812262 RepID=A0A917ILP1_9MICC|nr:nitrite reductase small subunit NirD [Rothia aerolata]GGH58164.1 nitrite reductase small subunit [Rothia aerolata]
MTDQIWHEVCALEDLEVNWGEVANIEGHQFAIFRLPDNRVFASDHKDPNSGALVIARGITGNKKGVPSIASPLYKEEYSLETGEQLNGSDFSLPVYATKVEDGTVFLKA